MAANSVSSGVSCVPPPCGRTLDGGISGFAISHSPQSNSTDPPHTEVNHLTT